MTTALGYIGVLTFYSFFHSKHDNKLHWREALNPAFLDITRKKALFM